MKNPTVVITSIQNETKALQQLKARLNGWNFIIVADNKTPKNCSGYLTVEKQNNLDYEIVSELPYNHYCRKNIGYLMALENGAEIIYDTDDDNFPNSEWVIPDFVVSDIEIIGNLKFFNIYTYFSSEKIWPRGYPLTQILSDSIPNKTVDRKSIGVWQGLVNGDPDIDAIHRLVFGGQFTFNKGQAIVLGKGTYSPFNSQNTFWTSEMIAYAYLPVTVSFRFTDILRGYIAQRCFWEHDQHLGITQATAEQERNDHNLLTDFEQEIPCYLRIEELVDLLNGLSLNCDYAYNLRTVYNNLLLKGFVKNEEIKTLNAWINDIKRIISVDG